MEITIPFSDISRYVSEHYGQTITFETVSNKEVEASFRKKVLIVNLNLKVEITIEKVNPAEITLSYDSNFAVEFIISKVLNYLKERYPDVGKGLTTASDQRVIIDLEKIDKAAPFTRNVALKEINIEDNSIRILASLK